MRIWDYYLNIGNMFEYLEFFFGIVGISEISVLIKFARFGISFSEDVIKLSNMVTECPLSINAKHV